MEYKGAKKSEPPDVSTTDQAHQQAARVPEAQQAARAAQPAVDDTSQHMPPAAFWAPAAAGLQHSSGSLPSQGPMLGSLSMSGLVSPMELESGIVVDEPLSTAGHLHGLWSGSNSRGTTPSSTTSSNGARLPPRIDRQASEPAMRQVTTPGSLGVLGQQQRRQQGSMSFNALSLPASPTMLQYQQAAAGSTRMAYSNLSSPSSGSWPDVDLGSGSLLAGIQQPMQGPESAGEGDVAMLVPSSASLLQQEPGLPLGLQLHVSAHMQASGQHQRQQQQPQADDLPGHLLRPQSPVLGGQRQQAGGSAAAAVAAAAAAALNQQHASAAALRRQQQQHRDAQLMPPPPPPQLMRSQSPAAVAAAAAAAAAADAAARAAARPPPLVIPSSCPPGSQQASAAASRLELFQQQQQQHAQQHQQQQQAYVGYERPGSAPTPSPAYPRSSTTITPQLLAMGLVETPALAAGHPGLVASGFSTGTYSMHQGDSSAGKGQRRQRRPKSLPSSPAIAPAAAVTGAAGAAGSSGGEYNGSAGILTSGGVAQHHLVTGAQQQQQQAAGLTSDASAALMAAGRAYVKVHCGVQAGWLDVRDNMIIVDVGTKKERKLTFAKFETLGGRGATRKWRTSINALPDGPGDAWVPHTMTLGELFKKLNTECHGQDTKAAAQPGSTSISSGGQGTAITGSSPQPRYSAAAAAAALVSPGQRRRREDSDEAEGQRPVSAEPHSRDDGLDDASEGLEAYASTKRARASQDGSLPTSCSQHSSQQQQQQAAAYAAGMGWLTSPGGSATGTGCGLSISVTGANPAGLSWAAAATPGGPSSSSGLPLSLPPQPPGLQQQQQQGSQGGFEQEQPAVLQLTPPDQLVAAMQQPPMPGSSVGSSQRARRPGQGAGGTPSCSQSPMAPAGCCPAVTSSQHHSSSSQRGRSHSQDDDRHQQHQQVSATGRPIRQHSRRAVSAAAAAAARLDSYDRDSGPVSYAGGLRFLQVWCDQLPGNLDLQRMMVIPQAGEREGQPMSLSQFEILGGRGSARKWRRSVSVDDDGQMISLGDWLEKYAEQPGGEGFTPGYTRYSAGPRQQRSTTTSPGVAGAAAAAAAAAGLPGSAGWQQQQQQQQRGQRDQGPQGPGAAGKGQGQGRRSGPCVSGYEQQQQGQGQWQQEPEKKQGSPVLEDYEEPLSQAGGMQSQLQQQGLGWGLGPQQQQQPGQQQLPPSQQLQAGGTGMRSVGAAGAAAASAGGAAGGDGNGPGGPLGSRGLLPYSMAPSGGPTAGGDGAGTVAGPVLQQQLGPTGLVVPMAPGAHDWAQAVASPAGPGPAAAAAGAAGASTASLNMGDAALNHEFAWLDQLVDPHLHPAQVDVDMADSSRSPMPVGAQLFVLGSPPAGSTAAAAAQVAAAGAGSMLGYPGGGMPPAGGALQAGGTGPAAGMQHTQEQQQQLLHSQHLLQVQQSQQQHGPSAAGYPGGSTYGLLQQQQQQQSQDAPGTM